MENITFDEFKKLDLRVGEIKTAEEIPGADKLYKLTVDLGGETRELVAGIKLFYEKDTLIGRKIVVLANLEPRTIRGVTSHGMLLAAGNEDKSVLAVLTPEKTIQNGAKVS
jgi:methionyl-tRNA synthetase